MLKNRYKVYLKGGGTKFEPIPDENPREAEIAYETSDELVCPIGLSLMIDPVFVSSGKTFDRISIVFEFARQKAINPRGILVCPFTKEQITGELIPNLQMRSITEKFFYQYKDVQFNGSRWNEIRRLCAQYQEEQTPENIEERKRENEKRVAESRPKLEQEKRIQEMERRFQLKFQEMEGTIQQKESVIQEQMIEMRRLQARHVVVESERERFARDAREKRDRLAREARAKRDRRFAREEQERLAIAKREPAVARDAELRAEIERARLEVERARLEVEKARVAREAEIAREAEREVERARAAREAERERVAKEEERNRQRQAAQIAAQEETARLDHIAKGSFYKQREPGKRRPR